MKGDSKTPRIASSVPKYSTIQPKPIIFSELHRKTYFNALERMLMSPSAIAKEGQITGTKAANDAFEEIFKKPPEGFDQKKAKRPRDNLNINKQSFDIEEADEHSDTNEKAKAS